LTSIEYSERYSEAKTLLEEAVQLYPDQPAIIDSLGWAEYRLGNLLQAEQHLKKAHEKYTRPGVVNASHLIEVLWKNNKLIEAEKLLAEMMVTFPDDTDLAAVKNRMAKE